MEESDTKKIHSEMIIEVMGTPKEHVVETLEAIVEQLKKENGVVVVSSKTHEPVKAKDLEGIYTTFSEIEIRTNDIFELSLLMFKYMPSHVEVISPENVNVKNDFLNTLLNEIVRRLHGYDNLARIFEVERSKLLEEIEKLKKEK